MAALEFLALHHIQLAMPAGEEERARSFYSGQLGFSEVAKPGVLTDRGGCWFEGNGIALHLGVDSPFVPAKKAHPAFEVADIKGAHHALRAANPSEVSMLPGIKRFYIEDPFGNRIEILERI